MATNNTVTLAAALQSLGTISVDANTIILAINPSTGQVGTANIPTASGGISTSIQTLSVANLNQIKQFFIDSGLFTTT